MECDDLASPLCQYDRVAPDVKPEEVHIIVWSRTDAPLPQSLASSGSGQPVGPSRPPPRQKNTRGAKKRRAGAGELSPPQESKCPRRSQRVISREPACDDAEPELAAASATSPCARDEPPRERAPAANVSQAAGSGRSGAALEEPAASPAQFQPQPLVHHLRQSNIASGTGNGSLELSTAAALPAQPTPPLERASANVPKASRSQREPSAKRLSPPLPRRTSPPPSPHRPAPAQRPLPWQDAVPVVTEPPVMVVADHVPTTQLLAARHPELAAAPLPVQPAAAKAVSYMELVKPLLGKRIVTPAAIGCTVRAKSYSAYQRKTAGDSGCPSPQAATPTASAPGGRLDTVSSAVQSPCAAAPAACTADSWDLTCLDELDYLL